MKISVVINTYNRMHTLPTTLRSLEFLRYPDLEIIVVDGPSTDGTLAYLEANWADKVKICVCPFANLSKSRNVGIQNATGDIVCFTDDDGVPEPDWLDRLVLAYVDPKVGAAGGWVRNHTGVDYQTKYIVSSRKSTSETLIENAADVPECRPHAETFPGLIGVNSSFRRTVLEEVGGFDEEYAYFLDETDVLARVVDAGYAVAMVPNAQVHHKYAPSHIRAQNGVARSWLQIITSTAYFILRNATPGTPLAQSMETIAMHKQHLRNHTNWFCKEGMIDLPRHGELMAEIERGAHTGVSDVFERPRRLMGEHALTPWKPFPRRAQAGKLRIAFVTALYPPRPCGGVAVFIHNLAKQLALSGHEITVITQAESGRGHTVDFEEGVWVHRLPENSDLPVVLPASMPDMPDHPRRVAGQVLAELDRVNEHRHFQYVVGTIWDLDIAAVIASGRYPTAMYLVTSYKLMEESKPEWRTNPGFYEGHVRKMIDAEVWALRNATHVLSSTRAILRDMEAVYDMQIERSKLTILPFGVPQGSPSRRTESADDALTVLYVGRFEQRKGADLLLECAPALLSRFPQCRIVCIGDHQIPALPDGRTYRDAFVEKYARASWFDRISFAGHVDDAELTQAYADCDIFVAPSRYESFGLIYLEAMRFGKPCIGTTAGGIPEVVSDKETGLLVAPGDRAGLQQALETLISDKKLRQTYGENGRSRYHEGFTTERFASRFEALAHEWIRQ